MGNYAVVRNNEVDDIIVLDEEQVDNFEIFLAAELIDAIPYGLCIGDLRVGDNWTRNINGVQTVLELLTPEQQTDYTELHNTIIALTAQLESINNQIKEAESFFLEGVESIG